MAGQKNLVLLCTFFGFLVNDGATVVIQALIDLDNDSEDLITSLISKVDAIIDPKVIDSKNATQELAYALLRLGPLITVSGNITDGTHGFSVSFSFNAKAAMNESTMQSAVQRVTKELKEDDIMKIQGGILQPVVEYLEPFLIGAATIVFNGIMSNIVANFMHEVSLLSNTNTC